jgi:hypothetical protein
VDYPHHPPSARRLGGILYLRHCRPYLWYVQLLAQLSPCLVCARARCSPDRECSLPSVADYLIHVRGEAGSAIAILVLYFVLFMLMLGSYLRTIVIINTDAPVVPLGPLAIGRRESQKSLQPPRIRRRARDVESQPYCATPDPNPDSPGLELFYTKNVFVCENDGRPKWCSDCCNWKPDRAHHSSEIGRCVIRMDHYCPWVGGMVAENCRLPTLASAHSPAC